MFQKRKPVYLRNNELAATAARRHVRGDIGGRPHRHLRGGLGPGAVPRPRLGRPRAHN